MKEYHKIESLWKRDVKGNFLVGEYSHPAFDYLFLNPWEFTEKIDGANIRIMWDGARLNYGGKTDAAQIPARLVAYLREVFEGDALGWFTARPGQVCLYGEGYGAGIQKGGGNYNPTGVSFVMFDVWVDGWWLERENVEAVGEALRLRVVPVLGYGTLNDLITKVSGGFDSQWGDFKAEGIVARPTTSLFTRSGQRIITKLKYKDFHRVKSES